MHTFFVNASKRSLNYYDILFDICHENMNLVSLEYPMDEWYSPEKGYIACAAKMAAEIDSNSEITNDFNLVVYIDLCEIRQYAAIARQEARSKAVFLRSLRTLYLHIICETLVKTLELDGRAPANTLIMLGEDAGMDSHFENDGTDRFRDDIARTMMGFFGLPTDEKVITDIARPICDSGEADPAAKLEEKLRELKLNSELQGARDAYAACIRQWYRDIVELKDVGNAFTNLNRYIEQIYNTEDRYSSVYWVSCPCDSYAFSRNKSAHALVQLSVACYLAECVQTSAVLGSDGKPRAFVLCNAARLAGILNVKKQTYASKIAEVERLSKVYSALALAPPLYVFHHQKFGLDEFGNRILSYEVEETECGDEGAEDQGSRIVRKEQEGESAFTKAEFDPFSYQGDEFADGISPGITDPNKYRTAAQKLREHHVKYLSRLREHTKRVLANYACDSVDNHKAILRKRPVSVADSDYADTARDYKYAHREPKPETQKAEVAADNAQRAYESAVMRYLEFCAARSLAVTDIEDQFAWIIRRIREIEESLKKLKVAGIGSLAALLTLYIPFVVIQWEGIVADPMTLLTAMGSLAAPVCVLGGIYFALAAWQKHKYYQVWKTFKEKSDAVLADNANAARMYDRMLAEIIPALRWIYEYKLDVAFHIDCCKMAKAKAEHHVTKLGERVNAIGNMIEDLEVSNIPQYPLEEKVAGGLDLNVSYCTGEKNISYYSILSREQLDMLQSREEV